MKIKECNEPGIELSQMKGNINKKLNNLLDFEDFDKTFKPEEQKKTKRTDVGLDVVKETKNEPGIEVSDLKKGIDKKLNNLLDFEDFDKTFKPEEQKKTKRTDVGLDIVKEDSSNLPVPFGQGKEDEFKDKRIPHDKKFGKPPETERWKNTIYFPSSSRPVKYTVGYDLTRGEWTCNCPAWKMARNGDKKRTCPHLRAISSFIGGEQGSRLRLEAKAKGESTNL